MKCVMWLFLVLATVLASAATPQQMLDDAVKKGQQILTLPAGTYRLNRQLLFQKVKDFTFDGNGSTLLMTNSGPAIRIEDCEDLTLKNFTIDYDPLPNTQGTVISVDMEKRVTRIRMHDGYPCPEKCDHPVQVYPFSPKTMSFKKGVREMYGAQLNPRTEPREFDVCTPHEPPLGVEPGDYYAIRLGTGPALWIWGNHNLTFEDITVNASPSLTFVARANSGLHRYKNIRILPGETLPAGANIPRLLSAGGDGVNYENSPARVELENCEFAFMGDDSFNIHGTLLPFYKQISPNVIRILTPYSFRAALLKNDMTVRLMAPDVFTILAENQITGIKVIPEKAPLEEVKKLFPSTMSVPVFQSVVELTLKNPLPEVPNGAFLDIKEMNGLGFSVKNCYFHDHRAYGLRMMSCNGIIENNRFERIKGSAIVFGGELTFWREAGHVENLIIRNNTIHDVGSYPGEYAAIKSNSRPEKFNVGVSANGNRNIVIENNTVSDCPCAGIALFGVKDIQVKNNVLSNLCPNGKDKTPSQAVLNVGIPKLEPISIGANVENCIVRDNVIK